MKKWWRASRTGITRPMAAKRGGESEGEPSAGRVGRGGAKLAAALDRFGLASRIAGAHALDVGASTGGFTETLLAAGAASVVSIDVGRDQLHPSLHGDPRVESLERTDFKTLSLRTAPGPFDFFTVDVSFVAARSMLRALAFRLRPGAEGVVLVKPQFELPDKRVRGGEVSDPALRADALARFRRKAKALGFALVEVIDSPIAGGSGTVELLAHLRFEGRTARLPQPGERKPRPAAAPRADVREPGLADRTLRWFAVSSPGVEATTAREVEGLPGVQEPRTVVGGVELKGTLATGLAANLWLRTASRVLLRVGEIEARDFARLRRRAAGLPWGELVAPGATIAVKATARSCRLYHTGAIAENVMLALGDRAVRAARDPSEDAESEPGVATLLVRGERDRFTFSLDASGELLHRRGWRQETGHAPLRETLAAALLLLCEYDPARPFVDPLCGAGTLPLEAAMIALRRAPGLGRTFAFERWPCVDAALWARLREEAAAGERAAVAAPIVGRDHSAAAIAAARRNAERAGLLAHVAIEAAPLAELRAPRFRPARAPGAAAGPREPGARGLVIANPPWGRRVGDPRRARAIYTELGRVLRERFRGWRAGILVADPAHASALGRPPVAEHALSSGGVRVRLLRFEL